MQKINPEYKKGDKISLSKEKLQNFISNYNNTEIAMQSGIVELVKFVLQLKS